MKEALIIYGSLTGNTQMCADFIAEELENHDIETTIYEAMEADPEDLLDFDIVLIGTYTYGNDAEIPDEMLDYYDAIPEFDLSDKFFGCFGSGDTFYPKYATAVDDFEEAFLKSGAQKVGPVVKVNLAPDTPEDLENLQTLAQQLAKAVGQ